MYIYAVDGPVSRQYPMHIFPLLAPKAAGVAVGHGVVPVDSVWRLLGKGFFFHDGWRQVCLHGHSAYVWWELQHARFWILLNTTAFVLYFGAISFVGRGAVAHIPSGKRKRPITAFGGFSMRASNGGCQQCQTTERQLWMAASCVEAARWRDERVVAFVSDCWYLNAGKHYSQCQYASSQA